jgi:hypothetical protein
LDVHPRALEPRPELVRIFYAAARYRRATVGSSNDDAHPDNSALHTNKTYSFLLHISRFVLLLLRQRRGATAKTWTPQSSTCEITTSGDAGIGLVPTLRYPIPKFRLETFSYQI